MELSLSISKEGPHKVKCPACDQFMRLVGIEPHPKIPDLVDLVTFECPCGHLIAEPHFAELELHRAPSGNAIEESNLNVHWGTASDHAGD